MIFLKSLWTGRRCHRISISERHKRSLPPPPPPCFVLKPPLLLKGRLNESAYGASVAATSCHGLIDRDDVTEDDGDTFPVFPAQREYFDPRLQAVETVKAAWIVSFFVEGGV